MDLLKPRAVVFDLGKVLLDFDFNRAALALAPQCTADAAGIMAIINQTPLLHRFETGLISRREFQADFVRAAGYGGTAQEFARDFTDIFWEIPEMIQLNRRFRSAGLSTHVFSNTSDLVVDFIRVRFPFFSEFDSYVLSYEQGCMKPSVPIYEAVEASTGFSGPELIYFDDREENVEAALRRGWSAHIYTDFQKASQWLANNSWLPA